MYIHKYTSYVYVECIYSFYRSLTYIYMWVTTTTQHMYICLHRQTFTIRTHAWHIHTHYTSTHITYINMFTYIHKLHIYIGYINAPPWRLENGAGCAGGCAGGEANAAGHRRPQRQRGTRERSASPLRTGRNSQESIFCKCTMRIWTLKIWAFQCSAKSACPSRTLAEVLKSQNFEFSKFGTLLNVPCECTRRMWKLKIWAFQRCARNTSPSRTSAEVLNSQIFDFWFPKIWHTAKFDLW